MVKMVLVLFPLSSSPPASLQACSCEGGVAGSSLLQSDTPAPYLLIETLSLKSPTQQRLVATLFLQARVFLSPLEFGHYFMICVFELHSFLHDFSSLCVLLWGPKVFAEPGRDRNSLFVRKRTLRLGEEHSQRCRTCALLHKHIDSSPNNMSRSRQSWQKNYETCYFPQNTS